MAVPAAATMAATAPCLTVAAARSREPPEADAHDDPGQHKCGNQKPGHISGADIECQEQDPSGAEDEQDSDCGPPCDHRGESHERENDAERVELQDGEMPQLRVLARR